MAKQRKNVLKLVCPRGVVEVYRKPITAGEVMSRKPRHFVTRPDVFEYPWVVVRPESVLQLGEVFYVVPARTIYRLLQSMGYYGSHNGEANLPQSDQTSPSDVWPYRRQSDIDHWNSVKRGSHHDCEKTERCNLGELDRVNLLSGLADAHLSNALVARRQFCDQESQNSLDHRTSMLLKEVALSNPRRRQLSLDSGEKRNHGMNKGYDSDSAQLKSNMAKRWSRSKQTLGHNLEEHDPASYATTRQSDKGSLRLGNLASLISKLPLARKSKLEEGSKRKVSANAVNPCKDMASNHENVAESHDPPIFDFKRGNARNECTSLSLLDVLSRDRHSYSSLKDADSNEAREFWSESVGPKQFLQIPSAEEKCPEEILSEDMSFTFDVPSRTETDVAPTPHSTWCNSTFVYSDCQSMEDNPHFHMNLQPLNSCRYIDGLSEAIEIRRDLSTDCISDSVSQIDPNNLLKTEVGYDRPEMSCTEAGNDRGQKTGLAKDSGYIEKDSEVRSCLRKTRNRLPATPRVKFTLPGEDHNNLRVEVFEFKED
ncbi:hypothetical protein MLD38_016833 [Melastoma candidum]|uniref:Uncharacterized protein n=1 Tax=Melastoma candidum TaxID=119954 RepID=A0ACB9QWY5_9MYRT|nr:hypothetical protein MLD38_016833 [Melastoma candidum]